MTALIKKLTLNFNIAPLRDDQHAKEVQRLLDLLPELVNDSFQKIEKGVNTFTQKKLIPSLAREITLPDMDVDMLISNPLFFAHTIAEFIFNRVYQDPLPNDGTTGLEGDQLEFIRRFGQFQPKNNIAYMHEGKEVSIAENGSEQLLEYLSSGFGSNVILMGLRADLMVSQLIEALTIRRPLAKQTLFNSQQKQDKQYDKLKRTPSGSLTYDLIQNTDFKKLLLTLLENALAKQRFIRLLSRASDKDKVIQALWRLLTIEPIEKREQELIRKTVTTSHGLKNALHLIILLSKKEVSQKGKRFAALLRVEFIPTLSTEQKHQLGSLFLNSQSEKLISAVQTWLTVAHIQAPGVKEQKALEKLILDDTENTYSDRPGQRSGLNEEKTDRFNAVSMDTELNSIPLALNLTPIQRQSVMAELGFWKQAREGVLALLNTKQEGEDWIKTLCILERKILNNRYELNGALTILKYQISLMRLYWQKSFWPLSESDRCYQTAIISRALMPFPTAHKQDIIKYGDSFIASLPANDDYTQWLTQALKGLQQQWQDLPEQDFKSFYSRLEQQWQRDKENHARQTLALIHVFESEVIQLVDGLSKTINTANLLRNSQFLLPVLCLDEQLELSAELNELINQPLSHTIIEKTSSLYNNLQTLIDKIKYRLSKITNSKRQSENNCDDTENDVRTLQENTHEAPLSKFNLSIGNTANTYLAQVSITHEILDAAVNNQLTIINNLNTDPAFLAQWKRAQQLEPEQTLAFIKAFVEDCQQLKDHQTTPTKATDLLRNSLLLFPTLLPDERKTFCEALKGLVSLKDKNLLASSSSLSNIVENIQKLLEQVKRRLGEQVTIPTELDQSIDVELIAEKRLLDIAHDFRLEQPLNLLMSMYPAGKNRSVLLQSLTEKWLELEQMLQSQEQKNDESNPTIALLTDWVNQHRPAIEQEPASLEEIKEKDQALTFNPLSQALQELPTLVAGEKTSLNSGNEKEIATKEPFQKLNKKSLQNALSHLDEKIQQLSASIIDENQVSYDAGLLIFWPFLSTLFQRLSLLSTYQEDDKQVTKFVSTQAQDKAYALLKGLLGEQEEHDGYLGVANILVGYELDTVVEQPIKLTDQDVGHLNELLSTVISRWDILKNMPVASFQSLFLKRECSISVSESGCHISVEKQTLDVLMQKMPWGLGMINLPWLEDAFLISVEWQY